MKQVVCQEAKECGVPEGVCFHQIAHDERDKEVCGLYMCHRAGFRVQCVYTPEPAKPVLPPLVKCEAASICKAPCSEHGKEPHVRLETCRNVCSTLFGGQNGAKCRPVPEPAKPHGVAFKGTASQLFRYLGGLTDERFQAMMHAGITIDTLDLKADALRVQEDANGPRPTEAEWEESMRAIIVEELQSNGFRDLVWEEFFPFRFTSRIVKLPRP